MDQDTESRSWVAAVPIAVGGLVLIEQGVLFQTWFRRTANGDWTLLWAAARAWGHLQPHEPFFWGQDYGSTFEAIPLELLRWLGVGFGAGLPLILSAGYLAFWWIPAAAAWRRGHRVLATVAVGAPLILTTDYIVTGSVTNSGGPVGRLLAGTAAALVILHPQRRVHVVTACGFGALAVALDPSCALLVVPACAYGVVRLAPWHRSDTWKTWALLGLACAPAAAWVTLTTWWASHHREDNLHASLTLRPQWHVLVEQLRDPYRVFKAFAPELLRSPWLVLAVIVVVVGRLLFSRRLAIVVAGVAFAVVLAVAISVPRSVSGLPTPYFRAYRTVLLLPVAVWFLAVVGPSVSWSRRASHRALAVVVAIVAVTGLYRVVTWQTRGHALQVEAESFPYYPTVPIAALDSRCYHIGRAAEQTGARAAIFDRDVANSPFDLRLETYACAALLDGKVETAYPPYERRSWVLRDLDHQHGKVALFIGATPQGCAQRIEHCRVVSPGITSVQLRGRSPLQTARDLGTLVRPYA